MSVSLERQRELQRSVPLLDIPHGTDIPFSVMEQHLRSIGFDGFFVLDVGCGQGDTTAQFAGEGYWVMAMDINPAAVAHAKALGARWTVVADATTFEVEDSETQSQLHGYFGGVILKATLCNLPGLGWKHALAHSVEALRPHGFLFLSETLLFHEYNPELEQVAHGEKSYNDQLVRWSKRYTANTYCGLPFGTIAVAKPSLSKESLEYGLPSAVSRLIASDDLERFVQHFSMTELCDSLVSFGMSNRELHRTIWQSREDMPLNGVWGVWQKN